MNEESNVKELFCRANEAVISQQTDILAGMSDSSLAVHHIITGASQSGKDFINDIGSGAFRIFSCGRINTDMRVIGSSAFVIAKFTADCEIYGTQRCERRLCIKPVLRKSGDDWLFIDIRISEWSE